jgi:hypothetical protein
MSCTSTATGGALRDTTNVKQTDRSGDIQHDSERPGHGSEHSKSQ